MQVIGAERRVTVDTQNFPLYGNNFSRAPLELIQKATTVLDPPTISNILAIVAPAGGYGAYKMSEICEILKTAVLGFAAARAESVNVMGGGFFFFQSLKVLTHL